MKLRVRKLSEGLGEAELRSGNRHNFGEPCRGCGIGILFEGQSARWAAWAGRHLGGRIRTPESTSYPISKQQSGGSVPVCIKYFTLEKIR